MKRIKPSLHKKFLFLLEAFLIRLGLKSISPTQHSGIVIAVRGKISVTGNAKTRTQ